MTFGGNSTLKDFKNNGNRGTWFVKYSADWCGHCQDLQPTWEEFTKTQQQTLEKKGVKVVSVSDKEIASVKNKLGGQEIRSFPTLHLVKDGQVTEFNKERTMEGLTSFIEEHVKTRQAGGNGKQGKKSSRGVSSRKSRRQRFLARGGAKSRRLSMKARNNKKSSSNSNNNSKKQRRRFLRN